MPWYGRKNCDDLDGVCRNGTGQPLPCTETRVPSYRCEFEFLGAPQVLGRCIRLQRSTERGHYGLSLWWIHGPVGTLDVSSSLTLGFAYSLIANDIQECWIDQSSRDQHYFLHGYRNAPWQAFRQKCAKSNWNVLHQSRSDRVPCYRGRTFHKQGLSQPFLGVASFTMELCNSCFEIYCGWGQNRDILRFGLKHLCIVNECRSFVGSESGW